MSGQRIKNSQSSTIRYYVASITRAVVEGINELYYTSLDFCLVGGSRC